MPKMPPDKIPDSQLLTLPTMLSLPICSQEINPLILADFKGSLPAAVNDGVADLNSVLAIAMINTFGV